MKADMEFAPVTWGIAKTAQIIGYFSFIPEAAERIACIEAVDAMNFFF